MTAEPTATGGAPFRWFVLEAEDPNLGCPVLQARFQVTDLTQLREVLGVDADDDEDLRCSYDLDDGQRAAITNRFGVGLEAGVHAVTLYPWHSICEVPYLIHTGIELFLMLEGRKPFAKFSDGYPSAWLGATGEVRAIREPGTHRSSRSYKPLVETAPLQWPRF